MSAALGVSCEELCALCRVAEEQTSATEAMETTLAVARLAKETGGDADPVRFLLCEIARLNYRLRWATSEREQAICEFVNGNDLAQQMIGPELGHDYILNAVREFLESLLLWNEEALEIARRRYKRGLHAWCEAEKKRRTGGS